MPDDLYDRDILSWSEHQADLLRRLARGERVNDIDWPHVVEEIEDVGRSELNAVRSYLRLMLVHLLKVQGWPASPAVEHWRREIMSFQSEAQQRFSASMRPAIDPAALYDRALHELKSARFDGLERGAWPESCPAGLDDLLNDDEFVLLARVAASATQP